MKTLKQIVGIVALTAALNTTQAQSWLTNGLIAYYPFNGNANDASGFNRHGIVHGATLCSDRFGKPNSAYAFDGASNYIEGSSTINDVANDFTMSMWFYGDTTNAAAPYLFTNMMIFPTHGQDIWGANSVGVGISAGTDVIRVWEHSHDFAPVVIEHSGFFSGWTHVVLIYSDRVPRLFINGSFVAQGNQSSRNPVRPSSGQPFTGPPHNQKGGFGGGEQLGGDGYWFRGRIDDIRIYNRAFSTNEVADLHSIESAPLLNIRQSVYLQSSNLKIGTNYQIQISTDLNDWTNHGEVFTANSRSVTLLRPMTGALRPKSFVPFCGNSTAESRFKQRLPTRARVPESRQPSSVHCRWLASTTSAFHPSHSDCATSVDPQLVFLSRTSPVHRATQEYLPWCANRR